MMKNNKVVVVDDHTLLSQAISGIVNSFENFEVLYTCKNGLELVNNFKQPQNIPDIVLMDVSMPVMDGIETTKWITKNHNDVMVMALSVEENEGTILNMVRAGAKGYLLKDVDKNTLETALKKLMETGFYHNNIVSDAMRNSFHHIEEEPVILKDVEVEFLKLICTELTYKEIADKMSLSPKTIDGYRDNLFIKLNVKNRIGLVLYAIKNKIFTP